MGKRIALFYVGQRFGGVEKIFSDLSFFLNKHGHECFLFVMDNREAAFPFAGKMQRICFSMKGDFKVTYFTVIQSFFALNHYKRKYKIDITISALELCNMLNLLNFSKSKEIVTFHNHKFQYEITPIFRDKVMERVLKKVLNKSSAITGVSNALCERVVSHYNFPPERVKTIYNSFGVSKISEVAKKPLPAGYEKFMTKNTFVTMSRFVEQKGLHKLILAFSLLQKEVSDAKLIMIGDGVLKDGLVMLADSLGISEHVLFTGFLAEPFNIIARARGFVFSSYYEGFGNVLVEAMSTGACVISTDCLAGPREIIAPGTNGSADSVEKCEFGILTKTHDGVWSTEIDDSVIQLKEAMQMLAEDDELYQHYKKQSLKRAQDFEHEKIYAQWLETINNC